MFDPFGAIETLRSLAESDSQIRAAAVSGSLTDSQSTPDLFSDCDAAVSSGIWNGQSRPTIPPCWHPGSAAW